MSETGGVYIDINGIVNSNAIERAELLLRNMPGAADKAIRSATNRAASYLRTASIKHIRERYDISAKNIRDKDVFRFFKYIMGQGACATVKFAGHKIPLYRYGGTKPKQPTMQNYWVNVKFGEEEHYFRPGVPVYAHTLKSTRPKFMGENVFVARMKNEKGEDHTGIFRRTGKPSPYDKNRESIEEIKGLSVPQMLGSEETIEKISLETVDKWEERLEHEINAFINGWRS